MSSPPTGRVARTSTSRWNNVTVEDLKKAARAVLWDAGIDYSPNKIARLCLRYLDHVQHKGCSFLDFLSVTVQVDAERLRRAATDPSVARVLTYADPTGELAVSNVIRGRSG